MFDVAPDQCPLCAELPDSASLFVKYGHESSGSWPAREDELLVVGAPTIETTTSHGNRCVKICPHCATLYAWRFTYEWFTNGGEDDMFLTRMPGDRQYDVVSSVFRQLRASTSASSDDPLRPPLAPTRLDERPQPHALLAALAGRSRIQPEELDAELERAKPGPGRWSAACTPAPRETQLVFGHRIPHPEGGPTGACLAACTLDDVSLRGRNLRGADLCGARASSLDAGLADLSDVFGYGSVWVGGCFDGASLRGADFSEATFIECSFVAADLRDCDFERAYFERCDVYRAVYDGSNFDPAHAVDVVV